jgi:hypothetical protein
MSRPKRINPHQRGTGEHVLFNSFRRHQLDAKRLQGEADWYQAKAKAARAAATSYAAALTALGHPPEGAALLIEGPKQ